MDVKIKSIHFDATSKLEEFINKKAQKLARRNESVSTFDVTLKVVKPETAMNKEASIKLTVPNAEDLFASKTADTFEEAIDLAIDALDRQLVKLKDKKK
ncbi:MAG TPA: ribosome-associated translation inhibitor RaiA [Candidatus Limisoma intestinavium]|uniref:Ribosome-associated translation inhibitor RaiA n=1 Tax=Candidatus Limisoma intestinavium TaxID=2840856 RepID=A0A9D1LFV5_9BACT|nr:ribosome-associated translation inhibitor RaiA [Candidatus Limisoma intestinavium]